MSMADRDGVIWYDGELVPWRNATTHVLTHTLHYGMGVFEGVRAYNTPQGTAIFRLQAHTDRLFDSAHIMGMKIPYSKDEINEATRAAVRENNLESAYIRPMVFYGSEAMGLRASGLKTQVIVAAWNWGAYMGDEALQVGIKVRTCSFTRHHVNISMYPRQGQRQLHQLDAGTCRKPSPVVPTRPCCWIPKAMWLRVRARTFPDRNRVIYTPEVTSCLNGITRNTILTLAAEHGFSHREAHHPR